MAEDLAEGNWFQDQGFADLLPQIKFGHELESFVISAEYGTLCAFSFTRSSLGSFSCVGTVYLKFTNGVREKAFMLLGKENWNQN